ncbi:hypothetical protein TorRG33x02_031010 [Trema orientale]|uniref:Morc S5 domain-containing protein n=1 Tax=Trema orientale TaxID=63057 RepID=A0A2P5FSY7_TREOI|nr:hypothetical protein TorRG33x02_031010 [Trema orientale]
MGMGYVVWVHISSSSSSSSDSDSGSDDNVSGRTGGGGSLLKKRRKLNELGFLPIIGDYEYEGAPCGDWASSSGNLILLVAFGHWSIGLPPYTFLRSTGREDIVVPMLDYESGGGGRKKMLQSSLSDWDKNLETIVQWPPFCNEAELLCQFYVMKDHGTQIFIYNHWEDDQGQLELEFDVDPHDIQIRGVNRDEKNIQMAKQFPNSRHFFTYRHSSRSYASILYLRVPPRFRIILRGKDVEHHNIINDMMFSEKVKYWSQPGADGISKDTNMVADVTIGFVKDAKYHIDVQGFNPLWRLWNAAGIQGRGVIGVVSDQISLL